MLGQLLHLFGSVHVACEILILLRSIRRSVKSSTEDRISALPDDLLLNILLLIPTKEAGATAILSKRWRSVWTMLPQLVYNGSDYKQGPEKKENTLWFIDQSLQLHKAPVLESLVIRLGPGCSADVDVEKWVGIAAGRRVRCLNFQLRLLSEPIVLPERLYLCNTLVWLTLFDKILVDVPDQVCLPSLEYLYLLSVVYKDDDSLVRLLSGCRVLKKLQSLEGSLIIDSPSLRNISLQDSTANTCSIVNKPPLDKALINVFCNLDDNFRRSLSSVTCLDLILNPGTVDCCNTSNFSQLIECRISPYGLFWLEPFMCLLQNSPKLKVLLIDQVVLRHENFPLTFNEPSCVPECLSNHLEIFEWEEYGGRDGEKEVVRYILANSKCLKRAGISIAPTCNTRKMMKELKSMSRFNSISASLLHSSKSLRYSFRLNSLTDHKIH
ncbi:unnamed protein product [Microthlaspi erraticum]|uniref:FBD domain-containing protein n=1 Tax=Microthlaspi erraticum TaxID=1685480 RepID=A0A6D2IR64_9BRAS|nr:unnamed protein product [Microthlaspi erraticum]